MQPGEAISGENADARDCFWSRYVMNVQAQGVKPTVVRWYVIRAEQYIRTVSHERLADHTPQDVTTYLEKLGRRGGITLGFRRGEERERGTSGCCSPSPANPC